MRSEDFAGSLRSQIYGGLDLAELFFVAATLIGEVPVTFRRFPFGLQSPGFYEGAEATVVSLLDVLGETTAGQLLRSQMIAYTLTAHSFSITAWICTITVLQVLLFFAFHS